MHRAEGLTAFPIVPSNGIPYEVQSETEPSRANSNTTNTCSGSESYWEQKENEVLNHM